MNVADVQRYLIQRGFMSGNADGLLSSRVYDAVDSALRAAGLTKISWDTNRKWIAAQQLTARNAGIDAGKIDGLLGPQTRHALELFDARKNGDEGNTFWRDGYIGKTVAAHNVVPKYNSPRERDLLKHYGPVGKNQTRLTFPYPMVLDWELSKPVASTMVHEKIHDNVREVFLRVADFYGLEKIKTLGLDRFAGCLNVRKKRGGNSWSTHAWGIAFDFWAEANQLKWNHKKARFARPEYEMWFRIWAEEGAVSLGQHSDFDWMHTQFAIP